MRQQGGRFDAMLQSIRERREDGAPCQSFFRSSSLPYLTRVGPNPQNLSGIALRVARFQAWEQGPSSFGTNRIQTRASFVGYLAGATVSVEYRHRSPAAAAELRR